jgi:Tfp pilus assembly protein PilF
VGNAPSTPAQPDDPPQADISVGTQTGTDSGSEDVTTDEGAAEAEATAEARAEASAAEESVTASAARADEDGSDAAQPDAAQPDAAQPDPGQTGETTAAVAVPAPDPIPPRPGVKPEAVKQRAAVQDAAPAPEPSPTPEPSRAAASPTQAPADPPTALTPETNGTGGQRAPQSGGVADLELETSAGAALAAANHRAAAQALRNDDPNRAARLYLDILKDSPRDPDALFGLALALSEMGLHAEARDTYRDLLNVEPGNRRALGNLVALAARGAPEGAVTRLRTLAERHPGFAPVHAQLANVQARQGDMSGALSAMRRAVRAAPDSLRFRYNLAVLYDRAEQPGAAARAYRRVLEIARRTGETDGLPMGSVRQRLRYLGG